MGTHLRFVGSLVLSLSLLTLSSASMVGCGGGSATSSHSHPDSGEAADSAVPPADSGPAPDATMPPPADATPPGMDSTTTNDAPADSAEDSSAADSGAEDSSAADTEVPDTFVADTFVADTFVADTFVADTFVADTAVADTSVADTTAGDTATGDSAVADTTPDASMADTSMTDTGMPDGTTTTTYTVGGTITGLTGGDTLGLKDNGGNTTFVTANGSFTLSTPLATGAAYSVTVAGNPTTPVPEMCTVQNGAGTVGTGNITSITVSCTVIGHYVGGTVSGLTSGTTLMLQDNGVDTLTIGGSGNASQSFQFTKPVANGATYSATVLTQPAGQLCYIPNPTGTVNGGDVTSIIVKCRTGLVAYYPFDEGSGTTILDATGNGNNGLHSGTYVAGVSGTALQFTGSSGAKVVGNAAFTWGAANADYTVDYWVWITTIQGNWVSPFHKTDMGSSDDCCGGYERSPSQFFGPGASTLYACMSTVSDGNHYPTPTPAFALGVWTHFATVHSGSTQILYINGVLQTTDPLPSATTGGQGILFLAYDTFYAGLIGKMDEVRVYSRALSAAEVQADML